MLHCTGTGVWTKSGKIAAAGVRATRWVSYHGIALNVCPDLTHFGDIVPCGLAQYQVTSVVQHGLSSELLAFGSSGTDGTEAQHGSDMLRENDCAALLTSYSQAIISKAAACFDLEVLQVRDALSDAAPVPTGVAASAAATEAV